MADVDIKFNLKGFDEIERQYNALPEQVDRAVQRAARRVSAAAYNRGLTRVAKEFDTNREIIRAHKRVFVSVSGNDIWVWIGTLPIKISSSLSVEVSNDAIKEYLRDELVPYIQDLYLKLFKEEIRKSVVFGRR